MIEIRQQFPGSKYWVVRDMEEIFKELTDKITCIVRNQQEKEMLDGYSLMYGKAINVEIGKHTLAPTSDDPYLFLWVVSVEELS